MLVRTTITLAVDTCDGRPPGSVTLPLHYKVTVILFVGRAPGQQRIHVLACCRKIKPLHGQCHGCGLVRSQVLLQVERRFTGGGQGDLIGAYSAVSIIQFNAIEYRGEALADSRSLCAVKAGTAGSSQSAEEPAV